MKRANVNIIIFEAYFLTIVMLSLLGKRNYEIIPEMTVGNE